MISHDRRFLANLSRATVWLDRGETRRIERGFRRFEAWRDEVLAEEERDQHKLDRKIVAEEHWLRYGVTGRRKRNVKRLGNLHALRDSAPHLSEARPARRTSPPPRPTNPARWCMEAKALRIAFDGRPIVSDFSTRIQRGDRIGIVGPNGSGKTTLVEPADRRAAAGLRHAAARRQSRHGDARPAPRKPRPRDRRWPTR